MLTLFRSLYKHTILEAFGVGIILKEAHEQKKPSLCLLAEFCYCKKFASHNLVKSKFLQFVPKGEYY